MLNIFDVIVSCSFCLVLTAITTISLFLLYCEVIDFRPVFLRVEPMNFVMWSRFMAMETWYRFLHILVILLDTLCFCRSNMLHPASVCNGWKPFAYNAWLFFKVTVCLANYLSRHKFNKIKYFLANEWCWIFST